MTVTTDQLATMEAAYYSGHKSVSYNGRTVVYQDASALWQAILNARQEMLVASSPQNVGGQHRFRFTTARGF